MELLEPTSRCQLSVIAYSWTVMKIEQQDPMVQAENRMEMEPDENLVPLLGPMIAGEDNQFQLTLKDADAEISPPVAKKGRQSETEKQEDKTTDGTLFTRRAKNVLATIVSTLEQSESKKITFEDILPRVPTRSSVAQKFNALLELKKWQAIELEQESVSTEAPALYGTIWIGEGEKMHETLKLPPGAVTPAQ